MENTSPVCGGDLPPILGFVENDPKSRSVNNSLQQLDFDQNSMTDFFYRSQLRPATIPFLQQLLLGNTLHGNQPRKLVARRIHFQPATSQEL